jgi:hypothetical protein
LPAKNISAQLFEPQLRMPNWAAGNCRFSFPRFTPTKVKTAKLMSHKQIKAFGASLRR